MGILVLAMLTVGCSPQDDGAVASSTTSPPAPSTSEGESTATTIAVNARYQCGPTDAPVVSAEVLGDLDELATVEVRLDGESLGTSEPLSLGDPGAAVATVNVALRSPADWGRRAEVVVRRADGATVLGQGEVRLMMSGIGVGCG